MSYSRLDKENNGTVQKFGRNSSISGPLEDIWTVGGAYNFLTAADTVRVAAGGDAADTAAGLGAREITVEGLDAQGNEISETIATAGISASASTTESFIRINRAYVSASGAYGAANTANVVIQTTGGTTVAQIDAGLGQTLQAIYTVPRGKTGFITRVQVSSSIALDVLLTTRSDILASAAPYQAPRIRQFWANVQFTTAATQTNLDSFIEVPELTDIWISGQNGSASDVSASFDVTLV